MLAERPIGNEPGTRFYDFVGEAKIQCQETEGDFIFEHIQPWLNQKTHINISKADLLEALQLLQKERKRDQEYLVFLRRARFRVYEEVQRYVKHKSDANPEYLPEEDERYNRMLKLVHYIGDLINVNEYKED